MPTDSITKDFVVKDYDAYLKLLQEIEEKEKQTMYRYFLFYYDYYPAGGMNDCVLKTTLFEDLEQYIHANYEDDYLIGIISYYDAVEDKTMYAVMDEYINEHHLVRFRFAGWTEEN